jgi:isochorismate hydrolase
MQVFFIENSKAFEECMSEFKENLDRKTKSLVKEIIEGTVKVSKEDLVAIEKKMIIDILLQMALGSPSNEKIVTEVSNALSSIMTEQDFENFSLLDKNNRLDSLKEIRLIVCGIVLFNKDNGVGETEDIPDGEV